MTLVYEHANPSSEISLGIAAISIFLLIISAWLAAGLPWVTYGKIYSLLDFNGDSDSNVGVKGLGVFGMALGLLVGAFALVRVDSMNAGPDDTNIDALPVVRGEISMIESLSYPSSTHRGMRWCIGKFIVANIDFDLTPGMNTVSFCTFRQMPIILRKGDNVVISHSNGKIYRIEKMQSVTE